MLWRLLACIYLLVTTPPKALKKDYTVVGHLTSHKYSDKVTQHNLISWAQRVGADAIVITGLDITTNLEGAVVLKYKSRSL